jgi:hypothetical protein
MARIDNVLDEVEAETNRFLTRLKEARFRFNADQYGASGSKESAALRRSALDLKQELTKITQSTGY